MVVGNETQEQDDQSWSDFKLYGGVYLAYTFTQGFNECLKLNMMGR